MQVQSISAARQAAQAAGTERQGVGFGDILSQAFEQAQSAQAQSEQTNLGLLTGEDTAIHTAMIEAQKAELTLNLAIQLRNKVVEAYNEVMRMQV